MRILPPRLAMLCLVAMAALRAWAPGPAIFPAPLNWLGAAPAGLGLALAISGAGQFRRIGTNIKTFNDPTRLVTDGLFRFSRNPMYLGFVLLLAGAAIVAGTASPFIVAAAFAVIADRWYIPFEERAMARTFGEAYDAYRRKVRRWI